MGRRDRCGRDIQVGRGWIALLPGWHDYIESSFPSVTVIGDDDWIVGARERWL